MELTSHPPRTGSLLLLLLLGFMFLLGFSSQAQEINGFRIQVNPDALTILKFNDDVQNFEFGKSDGFSAYVQDGTKLRIKSEPSSSTTNLTVTEGKRTHVFIIEVVRKIDINTFKGYYDYSDLKTIKKLIAAGAKVAIPNATASDASIKNPLQQPEISSNSEPVKQSKAEKASALKEQKAQAKVAAALAAKEAEEALHRQQEANKQQAAQQEKDEAVLHDKQRSKDEAQQKATAAREEKKRLKAEQALRDKEAKAELARNQQLEKENNDAIAASKKRQEEAAGKLKLQEQKQQSEEAARQKGIDAAKEKDRQALITQAAAKKAADAKQQKAASAEQAAQLQREQEEARKRQLQLDTEKKAQIAADKKRAAEEVAARKQDAALEAECKRQEDLVKRRQEEIKKEEKRVAELAAKRAQEQQRREAQEADRKRLMEEKALKTKQDQEDAAAKKKDRDEALIPNPYWKTEWHKKYPNINFAEIPAGQSITGEYYLARDTAANSAAAAKAMSGPARLNKKSVVVNGVTMVLESITLSGVNAFFRIRVINDGKEDFLVGKMMISWWKKEGGSFYLTPCYITEFPVIYPGKETLIVYACRGVNAGDKDDFAISLKERRSDQELQIAFSGNFYNKELNR